MLDKIDIKGTKIAPKLFPIMHTIINKTDSTVKQLAILKYPILAIECSKPHKINTETAKNIDNTELHSLYPLTAIYIKNPHIIALIKVCQSDWSINLDSQIILADSLISGIA